MMAQLAFHHIEVQNSSDLVGGTIPRVNSSDLVGGTRVLALGLGVVTTVLVVEAITHNEDHFQLGLKSSWSPLVKTRAREYRVKDNGGIPATRSAVGGFRGLCVLTRNPICCVRRGL